MCTQKNLFGEIGNSQKTSTQKHTSGRYTATAGLLFFSYHYCCCFNLFAYLCEFCFSFSLCFHFDYRRKLWCFFKLCVASIKLFAFHYQCIKWIERFLSRRFQRFFKLQIYERDLERCMMFAVIRNVDIFDVRVPILINFYFGRF